MKRRCQERLAKRYEGLSPAEKHRRVREQLETGTDELALPWQRGIAARKRRPAA